MCYKGRFFLSGPRWSTVQSVSCLSSSQTPTPMPNISDPRDRLQAQKGVTLALESAQGGTHLWVEPLPLERASDQGRGLHASAKGFLPACTISRMPWLSWWPFLPLYCVCVLLLLPGAQLRGWSQATLFQILSAPPPCCVTLDRLFNLSEHLLSHLQNGH